MSLKAKLEAVIYAAEEPVTLAQLAALFAADALAWKSAQESAAAAAAESVATDSQPRPNAEFDYQEPEQLSETVAEARQTEPGATAEVSPEAPEEPLPIAAADDGEREAAAEAAGEAAAQAPEEPLPIAAANGEREAAAEAAGEVEPEAGAEPEAVDAEAEEKRLARQRDRDGRAVLRGLLDELIATYASDDRGIEIKEIAGGYRMATKPECHDAARMFVKSLKPAMKLSLPALETLAVIAYKQPVTAPEVNEIRGVESSGVFGSLLARKLIATAGRKQVIGRPILYKTTKEFLLRFGLKDVQELPSMEEFEKMAQLEFEDMGPLAEAEAGAATGADGLPEVDEEPNETAVTTGQEPSEAAEGSTQEESSQKESSQEESTQEGRETAATPDSDPVPEVGKMDTLEPRAEAPASHADLPSAEAAPLAPSMPEVSDDPDETAATTGQQPSEAQQGRTEEESIQEGRETAATPDSDPVPGVGEAETLAPPAEAPAAHADRLPAEAASLAPSLPEVGDDPAETVTTMGQQPSEAGQGSIEEESTQEGRETAATADSDPVRELRETDTLEPPAEAPATHADRTPAEAAPAAPSFPEQAETETVSHE
jgi:segregation and condensation protein B